MCVVEDQKTKIFYTHTLSSHINDMITTRIDTRIYSLIKMHYNSFFNLLMIIPMISYDTSKEYNNLRQ